MSDCLEIADTIAEFLKEFDFEVVDKTAYPATNAIYQKKPAELLQVVAYIPKYACISVVKCLISRDRTRNDEFFFTIFSESKEGTRIVLVLGGDGVPMVAMDDYERYLKRESAKAVGYYLKDKAKDLDSEQKIVRGLDFIYRFQKVALKDTAKKFSIIPEYILAPISSDIFPVEKDFAIDKMRDDLMCFHRAMMKKFPKGYFPLK